MEINLNLFIGHA
jgi:hypothetical protein